MISVRYLIAGLLLSFTSLCATADPASEAHWRLLGPFRGGRVLAVAGVPGDAKHFYFGAVNGGVWETLDAGRTWRPIFDDEPVASIGALAIAPSNPDVIYVGTGEADMRSDIAHGAGIYKSVDAGRHWTFAGLEDTRQIGRIVIDPNNPDRVFVAALGHAYGPNAERGVFRSADGGKSWQKVLYKDDDTGAIDLVFKPGDANIIYASLWQTRRPPWNIYPPSNGPGSGLYKSTDGGTSWQAIIGKGFPDQAGHIGLAVAPSQPDRVYALADAKDGGLYRSDDGGASWTRVSADSRLWKRGWYFGGVTVEPNDANIVYVCNTAMYRSSDGGKSFVPIKGAPGGDDYHQLWIDPTEPARRILGVDQGAIVSLNSGATWSSWYNQPTGQFYHVATDNRFPYWVYGAQQDSGAAGIPSRGSSSIDGINMSQFRETTAGGESDNIAPDPDDPELIYGGRVDKLDLRTEQTTSIDPTLAYPDHYRATWTLPLTFSKRDPHVLYFANQHLFRTANGGTHWDIISPDLTRENPQVPTTLDAPTVADNEQRGPRRGVIYSIAPSPLRDHLLWTGTDDGLIWRTLDEGRHWQNVTPDSLTAWSKVGVVEASHFDVDTAYAAIDRHRLDDDRPLILRTHDGGKSWQTITDGIDSSSAVNVVREDPIKKGLLYAGTEKAAYVSYDDGDHWQSLRANMPVTSIRDIDVHGTDIVIATHGRGFWVLDDVTAFRQWSPEIANAEAWLFAPARTYRVRPQGFTGTPLPKDEAIAVNPAAGASIDYFLKSTTTIPLTFSIYDAKGALVRRYSSTTPIAAADLGKIDIAPEWISAPALQTTAGLHRLSWDFHYTAAPSRLAQDPTAEGVWAPPGLYTLDMESGGEHLKQTLQVRADPRLHLPLTAYTQQFSLAQKLESERARLATAMSEAKHLHQALADVEKSANADLSAASIQLDEAVLALSDIEVDDPRNSMGSPPKSLTGFVFLDASLQKLAVAVDGADRAPSVDSGISDAKLAATLNSTLTAWQTLKTRDLAALNAKLSASGQPTISLATPVAQ